MVNKKDKSPSLRELKLSWEGWEEENKGKEKIKENNSKIYSIRYRGEINAGKEIGCFRMG